MVVTSPSAASRALSLSFASPMPTLTTTLSSRGTCTPPRLCPALLWRLRMLTPLTTILCWSGIVRRTSPCLPLSLPAMTITGSPGARSSQRRVVSGLFLSMVLEDLRGERDDFHEVALAQLARDGPEDPGAARVVGCGEKHGRVLRSGEHTSE